jgi:capsular polysaccharide biosynthesis protein
VAARERNGRQTITGRRVFCGFNRHWQNYAHWLTQCVPAIAGYALDPGFRDGVLLLPRLPEGYERALTLVGIALPEIVRADMDTVLAADELVYSSLLLHHDMPSCLARRVFDHLSQSVCADPLPDTWIYVSRADSSARPMRNEVELATTLAAFGIETVVPGTLSIEQQIRTFRAARLVIGPHGAGLGNIVFCRPRTVMYELMPEHWADSFVGPSINLFAQTSRMHYWADCHPVQGNWAQFGHKVPWAADLEVTLARLGQIIERYPDACPALLRTP